MFDIVGALKAGNYHGFSFIPFDIEDNENDTDELKEAKNALKELMKDTLSKIGAMSR